jgi:hypothetical protein
MNGGGGVSILCSCLLSLWWTEYQHYSSRAWTHYSEFIGELVTHMKEPERRRRTVMSSLNEMSTEQLASGQVLKATWTVFYCTSDICLSCKDDLTTYALFILILFDQSFQSDKLKSILSSLSFIWADQSRIYTHGFCTYVCWRCFHI